MGTDYCIACVKRIDQGRVTWVEGEDEDIPGAYYGGTRYYEYCYLFHPEDNQKVFRHLEKPVSFDWFTRARKIGGPDEANMVMENSFSPGTVQECVEEVMRVIREHDQEFPVHYMLWTDPFRGVSSTHIFLKNGFFYVRCGWDRCGAWPCDQEGNQLRQETIDLRDMNELRGHAARYEEGEKPFTRKWLKGEERLLEIRKESFYQFWKRELDRILEVCRFALRNDYLLFSFQDY